MSTAQRVVAVVLLSAWFCPRAFAPISGTYPGLHSLIKEAEIVGAITILQQLSDEDFGGSARYKIQFEKVLKGSPSEKQVVAHLRKLEITPEAEIEAALRNSAAPQPAQSPPITRYFAPVERFDAFRPSSRWIAFLTKARKEVEATYENVNCAGSTFPISARTELDALKVQPLPDTLIALYRDYVDFKRAELKEWEKQLDAFIQERDQ